MNHRVAQYRLKHFNIGLVCAILTFSALQYPVIALFAAALVLAGAFAAVSDIIELEMF